MIKYNLSTTSPIKIVALHKLDFLLQLSQSYSSFNVIFKWSSQFILASDKAS